MDTNEEIRALRQQIEELVESIQKLSEKQNTQYTDIMLLLKAIEGKLQASEMDEESIDDTYEEAKEIVTEAQTASTSYLQRSLRIGYARAARLMDMLEEKGVIGPADGAKPRQVLIKENDE
jgi:S-DNA-T family DNA segregation ATPase FtsK/SpoIIIE